MLLRQGSTARTAAVIAVAGVVAALTSAPATAHPSASGVGSPTTTAAGSRAPGIDPVDSDVVPMNFAINAYEIRDNDHKSNGHIERTFKKSTRAVKKIVLAEDGTILRSYPKIGVVVAYTEDPDFDDRLRGAEYSDRIESLGATRTAPSSIPDLPTGVLNKSNPFTRAVIEPEPREDEQWGNDAIDSLAANEIQPGSADVLVGVLDTGIQSDHEDLAAAIDKDASVDCSDNGIENTDEAAWNPTAFAHGTHVAGTIAGQRNGIGIAGVAPGVKVASIKVTNDDGFIYPEYAICGFMWAPKHGVDVTNNSYYIDPWFLWCDDDVEQGAVQESVRRAVAWTEKKRIVNMASAHNFDYDLANKVTDSTSPDDTKPIPDRPVNEACLDLPVELPGVIAVSATTVAGLKASFSNYGDGVIDVAGPGENILSTLWPDTYGFYSGTSMASPHVAGTVALILSQFPDLTPKEVRQRINDTAVDVPCGDDPRCTGTPEYNGFFGNGLVNALNAITAP